MPLEKLREEAETAMRELLMLAQHTSELYHELQALDKFQQDYRQRLREEESLLVSERGDGLVILGRQLRNQRKIVSNLKKRSLWSRSLEEIVEKLVEVVEFLHKEISTAFGFSGMDVDYVPVDNRERLGVSGLALHYANVIKRIEVIVSRPISMPSNARNMLYNGLPMSVKAALRSRLQSYAMEQLTTSQLKVEIQKILQWMVPMAENTIKAHQGFGWVGEWANMGTDVKSPNVPRILTLYHAEKEKTDEYILQLVVWLHHLVVQIKETGYDTRSPQTKNPLSQKTFPHPRNPTLTKLSEEDRKMLERVGYGRLVLGRSKSHGYQAMKMRPSKKRLCRSWSSNSLLETRLPSMRKGLDEIDSSLDVFSSGILTYT